MLAMRILFCSCLCKVRTQISDALLQALCNLSLAFLANLTLSDSTTLIRFIAFSRKLHSAFVWIERHDHRVHVFHLTGTGALHYGHTFVGGIFTHTVLPMANQTRNKRLSTASHVVQIHTHARFPRNKKMADLSCSHMPYKQETL